MFFRLKNYTIKKPIKDYFTPFIPRFILFHLRKKWENLIFNKWQRSGSPVPPPHIVKQMAINEYQEKYEYSIFIETGTYKGGMVEAQRKKFTKIISIELDSELCRKAQNRLKRILILPLYWATVEKFSLKS